MKVILRKTFNRLIQVAILILSYGFIYRQVFHNLEFAKIWDDIAGDVSGMLSSWQFLLVFLMMIINWGVESFKWQYLMKKVEPVGFFRAYEAVLTGVTISSFTPNRIGEYFGRVFIMRRASRFEGVLVTILGSMSQLFITILTGSIAMLLFIPEYVSMDFGSHDYLYYVIVAVVIAFDGLLLLLLLNVSFVAGIRESLFVNGLRKFRKFFNVFAMFSGRQVMTVILLCLIRYLIFTSQFYLLLLLFEVPVSWFYAIWLISLIYLIMAVIPTVALTELGIRGSISIYIFGLYFAGCLPSVRESAAFGVFAASTLLWIINLGIPALAGGLLVFRLKFFRKLNRNNAS